MPRARRICTAPGCAEITTTTRCPTHQADYERARGTRQQRGYGKAHDKLRARWAPHVATGNINCWRCHHAIEPGTPWHLGHLDDRSGYGGPEHELCNTAAGGRAAHGG